MSELSMKNALAAATSVRAARVAAGQADEELAAAHRDLASALSRVEAASSRFGFRSGSGLMVTQSGIGTARVECVGCGSVDHVESGYAAETKSNVIHDERCPWAPRETPCD